MLSDVLLLYLPLKPEQSYKKKERGVVAHALTPALF